MMSFRQLLKKTTRREALKIKLERSIASGQFFRFKSAKRNNLLLKFYRLSKGVSDLKWQVKIAALGGALVSLTPFEKVQAQQIGPFVEQSRLNNPLRPPLPGGRLKAASIDLDNDGDYDIVYSAYSNYLKIYLNNGDGSFEDGGALFEEKIGEGGDTYSYYIDSGYPSFADLDGDGNLDLIVGARYSGTTRFYLNNDNGTATDLPTFSSSGSLSNPFESLDALASQSHFFIDYDGDGDQDVFISGTSYASDEPQLLYYENTGPAGFSPAVFEGPQSIEGLPNFFNTEYGSLVKVVVADLDNDGQIDILQGGAGGYLNFFKGTGSSFVKQEGEWNPVSKTGNPFDGETFGYGRTTPFLIDFDKDGDMDVATGYSQGYLGSVEPLALFENKGNGVFERRVFLDNPFGGAATGRLGTANFVDLDGDGEIDALLGGKYENSLAIYKNTGNKFSNISGIDNRFKDLIEDLIRWEGAIPGSIDIDDDGDLDLILGSYYGRLTFFLNDEGTLVRQIMNESNPLSGVGSYDNYNYVTGNYYSVFTGGISYFDLADIDNDGDFDIFVSDDAGKIKFFQNTGDKQNPRFEAPEDPTENPLDESHISEFASGSFGSSGDVSPRFVDLDHDGDLDLLLGGRTGDPYYKYSVKGIFLFENTGTAAAAEFTSKGLLIPSAYYLPSPGVLDADSDGDLDIFIGSRYGTFAYYLNENPAPVTTIDNSLIEYAFESGPATLAASLTIDDSDGDEIVGATVTIQNFQAGNEVLAFTTESPIIGNFNATTGVLTLSGRSSTTSYRNVLRTVTYNYIGPDPGPPASGGRTRALNRTVAFAVFDQDLTSPAFVAKPIIISSPVVAPPPPQEIIVYNGMSPNGDTFNQFFNIENIQILGPENKVSIFNRWGDKVFEINNYDNTTRRFEGVSDSGKELASGVYFYRIQFSNGLPELKGYLTLKR